MNNHRDHEKWEKVPLIPPWGEIKLDSVMHKILGTCMAHLDAEVHCIDWAHSSVPEIIQSVKHTISFMIIQTNKKNTTQVCTMLWNVHTSFKLHNNL